MMAVRALSSFIRSAGSLLRLAGRAYSQQSQQPLGFIGLGNMGLPMAQNLLANGHQLVLYDISESRVGEVGGGQAVASPAEVASRCPTVVTMLPSGTNVMQCYTGERGILSAVQPGTLLIDSSTVAPEEARHVASLCQERTAEFIDAPVSGGVGAAKKGTLSFLVGGAKKNYKKATPLLQCMGKNVIYCGDHGSGQAAKVCNNMLLGISMIGTSEALQLAIRLGLDPHVMSKVINSASGRCWSSEVYNPCPGVMEGVPASNGYQGGFGTALMAKDLGLSQQVANSSGAVTPLGAQALQLYRLMCQSGYASKDFSSVFKFLEEQDTE